MSKLYIMSAKDQPRFFELKYGITYLGRSAINDVQIKDRHVSREHLLLRKSGNKYFVRDLGSKNGTFVDGNQIRSGTEVEIKEGVSIVVGMSVICLGELCSEEVQALIGSISSPEEYSATDTLVTKRSEFQSVKRKPNNLGSNLKPGTCHSSNIKFSKSN